LWRSPATIAAPQCWPRETRQKIDIFNHVSEFFDRHILGGPGKASSCMANATVSVDLTMVSDPDEFGDAVRRGAA
jgi:hypothetical protein